MSNQEIMNKNEESHTCYTKEPHGYRIKFPCLVCKKNLISKVCPGVILPGLHNFIDYDLSEEYTICGKCGIYLRICP